MDIKVYEDQTGLMVFPENRSQKYDNIVKLFHNKVDLFIKKTGNKLEIGCYTLAHKGLARDLGYYIIYTNLYNDTIFANFKKDADKILLDLKFQTSYNNPENIIFDNMYIFDPTPGTKLDYGFGYNIDLVKNAVNEGKRLEYIAGNINEISIFCRDVLKRVNNVEIYITSGENKLGNINISRKKYEKLFFPSESTKQILNEYEKKFKYYKDKEGEILGKEKIAEGFSGPIKDGINIFKNIGHDPTESIIEEMTKVIDINKIYNTLTNKINLKSKVKKEGLGIISKIFIGLTILIVGMAIGMVIQPIFEGKFLKETENPATVTTNPTTTPIDMTPAPSSTPIPTEQASIPANISTPNISTTNMSTTNMSTTNMSTTPANISILNSYPENIVINSPVDEQMTFNITTNQLADIIWRLNGIKVQYTQSVNSSNYTNSALVPGTFIVSATADTANGSAYREWTWNITKGR